MEIGIPRGRFQVIRVHPNEQQPDGAFVVRIQDNESGITVITTLSTEDGIRFAEGFHTRGDPTGPAPVIELPSDADTRVFGGGAERRVESEPAETFEEGGIAGPVSPDQPHAPAEETPAG